MRSWNELPEKMQNDEVRYYYDILCKKERALKAKRVFDFSLAMVLSILLLPIMVIIAIMIKTDSKGPVFYRQVRVTAWGRKFKIYKFRTMVQNADKIGSQITSREDVRVTKVGKWIRKVRLDEIPQLFNVLAGDMSFVGTRPEVPKYVVHYDNRMLATLLMPAGITSRASIEFKDEDVLLAGAEDIDEAYIRKVLPAKMAYNLKELECFSLLRDLYTMILTVFAVLRKQEQ